MPPSPFTRHLGKGARVHARSWSSSIASFTWTLTTLITVLIIECTRRTEATEQVERQRRIIEGLREEVQVCLRGGLV